jgi:pimeloyl-ACP methyl ester carboxylesterase
MTRTFCLASLVIALSPTLVGAQVKGPKDALVIFRDGFFIKGKSAQKRDVIIDPATGASLPIAASGESIYLDDGARRINFSLGQVQDVLEVDPNEIKNQLIFTLVKVGRRSGQIQPGLEYESVSDWTDKGERFLKVRGPAGDKKLVQRITAISPTMLVGITTGADWDFAYLTKEFPPGKLRAIVLNYLATQVKLKEFEQHQLLARFMAQVGWYDLAVYELKQLGERFPDQKESIKDILGQVRRQQADAFADEVERMYRIGQHTRAQGELNYFLKSDDVNQVLSDKHRLALQDLKSRYDVLTAQVNDAEQYLREFGKSASEPETWTAACNTIADELHSDSVGRLKTFLEVAPQHAKELAADKKPTQSTDEVLALAVTGWLQGDGAASTDPKFGLDLFRAREFLLKYLRTESSVERAKNLSSYSRAPAVPLDVLIRLIRNLPPAEPYSKKLNVKEPTELSIDLADSNGGKYYLMVPPEYNPQRSYPVLVLLHSHRERADVLVKRWQEQAARYGYILAAPVWGTGLRPAYQYSKAEHAVVLDTLRDVRHKFNVDSDRVFLFGWEQGANAAFDIGLAHPDQFAGVLPMNGDTRGFPAKYSANAQYLPFYIVEGDRNGGNPKTTRDLFKQWMRGHYPSLYLEYKGRSSEWYSGELPTMMDWMNRKKRFHPLKEMGRHHTSGVAGMGDEFKTMRTCDNRYYWLSTDEVLDQHLNSASSFSSRTQPATLTASVGTPNEGTKAGARIWSQFTIRTSGVKQVSLWIAPNMIDFTKPVVVRINGQQYGGYRNIQPSLPTLLEEVYVTGDRQRLFVAKLDFRL